MSDKPYQSPLPIIAILAILLLLIGGYVGAYLGAGFRIDDKTTSGGIGTIERTYTSKWAVERDRFESAIRDTKEAKQETANSKEETLSWRRTSKRLNDERESIGKQLGNYGFVIRPSLSGGPRVYEGPKP